MKRQQGYWKAIFHPEKLGKNIKLMPTWFPHNPMTIQNIQYII